ncbi:MAG TPA: SpoIIE family protein phosphatase [Candidatus Tumulicola sp.]|jgi:serine phosphatase RsbU (regulator of sigma subunit)
MTRDARWTLTAAVTALICFIVVFAVAGSFVRSIVSDAFGESENVRIARALLAAVVTQQLDEESGLRGYAVTGERLFLEPYRTGREKLPQSLARLQMLTDRLALPEASADVRDAAATARLWRRTVADPMLQARGKSTAVLESRGKALVDRFRRQTDRLDATLARRRVAANVGVQDAIRRVGLFVLVAIGITATLAALLIGAQLRASTRDERERLRAEQDRVRATELRAAYLTEKRIAESLQSALVQRPLPAMPALLLSARYAPAQEEARVGGDWYDVLELPEERVLFAIGDVAGHGIDAAVTMNRARQALVSSAMLDLDPAFILAHANADLLREEATMVTAIAGFADYRRYEFVLAIAGHPPPLLIESGGATHLLACGGLPLGISPASTYRVQRVQASPGSTIVLYTDGAIEHSRDALEGERIFVDAAAAAVKSPAAPASAIYETIFENRHANDDVAILTIGFPSSGRQAGKRFSRRSASTKTLDLAPVTIESFSERRRAPSDGWRTAS